MTTKNPALVVALTAANPGAGAAYLASHGGLPSGAMAVVAAALVAPVGLLLGLLLRSIEQGAPSAHPQKVMPVAAIQPAFDESNARARAAKGAAR